MGVNRHPFVKDKWDERAYFLVQDVLYEGMEDGHVSVNAGISDLAILAFIRATCSRPGALSKDWFDMSGAIAKWASVGGENVMSVSALTFSRDGFSIKLPDGTIENGAQRGEIDMTRIKALYDEAAASGYTYWESSVSRGSCNEIRCVAGEDGRRVPPAHSGGGGLLA